MVTNTDATRELGVLALKLASNKKTRKHFLAMVKRIPAQATRQLLVDLFGSQMEASRRLHFHERTVRWWCQHGAPPHVLQTLELLRHSKISLRWARHLIRTKRSRRTLNGRHGRRA